MSRRKKTPPPPPRPAVKKTEGSARARRTAARLAAVQALYQMRLNNQAAAPVLREFSECRIGFSLDGDVLVPADEALLSGIVGGVEQRWDDVEAVVSKALLDGGREEVEPLLSCILFAGVYELLAHAEVDAGIIINDYLNVTNGFYDGGETKLVNAILDRAAKAVR